MKHLLLTISLAFASLFSIAQSATNFTANDCAAVSHNLFSELNSGKVIVLVWVMPCGVCVGPSLTTYNVVESYSTSKPNTVKMYLCDDVANTNCASLNSWKTSNNLTNATTFSNASIKMSDYGSSGMPKIVVIGGASHTVFYNSNNTVDATALQNAINSALATAGINEQTSPVSSLTVFPNPASKKAEIKFTLAKTSDLTLDLFDLKGKKIKNIFTGNLSAGENKIDLNYSGIVSGTYLLKLSDGDKSKYLNVVIAH